MTHRNARLTPVTRAELVEQVLAGWPQAEVARLFRVSRATVAKWVRRFREGGPDALLDRSSRPLRSPRQTDQLQEAAICATRRMLAWGPHRIGWRLGIARSTVYAVLRRAGLHRTTREVVRYEHALPGALVHLDIKKLGRIPQGGGKRILPGFAETHSGPQQALVKTSQANEREIYRILLTANLKGRCKEARADTETKSVPPLMRLQVFP